MQNYMICDSQDYADEFDYPILSVFDDTELSEFNIAFEKARDNGIDLNEKREIGFGTNEALIFSLSDMQDEITSAVKITEDELKFVTKHSFIGVDIFDVAMEIVSEFNES